MLWNVDAHAKDVMDDYFAKGFGPAAESIKSHVAAFSRQWKETKSGTDLPAAPESRLSLMHLYDDEFLAHRQQELNQAVHEAKGNEEVLKRISFIQKGLDYTRLYVKAIQATMDVYRASGANTLAELKEAAVSREIIEKAANSWEQY